MEQKKGGNWVKMVKMGEKRRKLGKSEENASKWSKMSKKKEEIGGN